MYLINYTIIAKQGKRKAELYFTQNKKIIITIEIAILSEDCSTAKETVQFVYRLREKNETGYHLSRNVSRNPYSFEQAVYLLLQKRPESQMNRVRYLWSHYPISLSVISKIV